MHPFGSLVSSYPTIELALRVLDNIQLKMNIVSFQDVYLVIAGPLMLSLIMLYGFFSWVPINFRKASKSTRASKRRGKFPENICQGTIFSFHSHGG